LIHILTGQSAGLLKVSNNHFERACIQFNQMHFSLMANCKNFNWQLEDYYQNHLEDAGKVNFIVIATAATVVAIAH